MPQRGSENQEKKEAAQISRLWEKVGRRGVIENARLVVHTGRPRGAGKITGREGTDSSA